LQTVLTLTLCLSHFEKMAEATWNISVYWPIWIWLCTCSPPMQ
jgi:hypothetical protein